MTDLVTLYTNPYSRGRIVHLFLEAAEIPYRIELLDFATGDHKKPDFLAKNPMGKLPVIEFRGTFVSETAAIITWLGDVFPKSGLMPPIDDPARGLVLKWLFFGAGCIEPATADKAFNRPPVGKGSVGWGTYDDVVNTLLVGLDLGPFLLGDRLTAADLYVGSQVAWALHQKTLEPHFQFVRLVEALKSLPAQERVQNQTIAMVAELDRRRPKP